MASISTLPHVHSTLSGIFSMPAEVRSMIYRLLFDGSIIQVTWINGMPSWDPYFPRVWQNMKAIHARDSGYGIFFASKANQEDSAAVLYSVVTWHMTRIHPVALHMILINSFDMSRFQRLSWNAGVLPDDCKGYLCMFREMKCLSLATNTCEPLELALPTHHMEHTALVAKIETHLRTAWCCNPKYPIHERELSMKCTIWCSYPQYKLENGKTKIDDQSNIMWSSRASPPCRLQPSLLANIGTVDFRHR